VIDFRNVSRELRSMLAGVEVPEVALVEQELPSQPAIEDVVAGVGEALAATALPRGTVAVAVGSRGIARIDEIVRALVAALVAGGARPFIVPAMGSHGAANAEGQRRVLAHLGITPESAGCPIEATMDTVSLGRSASGVEVFVDSLAFAADAIVVVNRIKLHTSFRGPIESGPTKMLAVGLGKRAGADSIHAGGWEAMHEHVPSAARTVLATGKVAFALAILENADERPCRFVALPAAELIERERALLEEVRASFPRLPFRELDVLAVDRVGKNVSGGGGDPNVTGRFPGRHMRGDIDVRRLAYMSLTPEGEGNANGIGLADVVTAELAAAYVPSATYLNALTTTAAENARLPMVMPSRELALAAALKMVPGLAHTRDARLVRVLDTLHVRRFFASRAAVDDLARRAAARYRMLTPFAPPELNDESYAARAGERSTTGVPWEFSRELS
jgi:hypothetical protein